MVDPFSGLLLVSEILGRLGRNYCVGGSIASSAHRISRSTFSADVVANLKIEHVEALVAALGDAFYADADMMHDAIARRGTFNLIHYATGLKVDIFIPQDQGI
jgi:hypothetical protein